MMRKPLKKKDPGKRLNWKCYNFVWGCRYRLGYKEVDCI